MNYADLFRVTLPETALEVAALLVLVVDLAFLRKAALGVRAAFASALGVVGCFVSILCVGRSASYPEIKSLDGVLHIPVGFDGIVLQSGGYTSVAQIAILVLTALTLLLLLDSGFTRHVGEFVAVTLMSAAGGLIIAGAQDLLVIFIGLELLSLGLYVLAAFAKASGKSAEAALKYYLFGGMSAACLLFGFSYLYGLSGSTSLNRVMLGILVSVSHGGSPLLYVAVVLVAAGLGFKVAAVPFHFWAPDAYEGSPAPAAAFIASVSKVASFALLISISVASLHFWESFHTVGHVSIRSFAPGEQRPAEFLGFDYAWTLVVVILSAASMAFGNLAALVQISVRRLLAYSAIAHAGYVLLGLAYFSRTPRSTEAILYYIVTYGLTTVGAFGVVGVVERATGTDRMDGFLGLGKRNPLLAAVLLVLLLSLAGIPPLVGFWAKFNLFAAVLGAGGGVTPLVLVALAVAFSAVSLYYYLQVLKRAYVMPAVEQTPIRTHPMTLAVLLAIAAAVVVLGCFPGLLQNWIAGYFPPM
ncbi:MAG TPA: NADH-quinone oxidoreductase subunit N [Terracidiphilus sp.]|nr:NADH-quinone oxidoreductase subunit N [Terracidiphilus sp.]